MQNTDKVTILLATYNPNIEWLKELLISLNNQDYENIELLVLDDCSKEDSFKQIKELLKSQITKFKYSISQNEKNYGSNKTFEELIKKAASKYIAFCDQDDIWFSNKISYSLNYLKENEKKLACGDVTVIDQDGKLLANSITKIHKRIDFYPEDITTSLIYRNFVTGCTIIMEKELALKALPFSSTMVHDQQLGFVASLTNDLCVYDKPLMKYRLHSSNQTTVLGQVFTKDDYLKYNIIKFKDWVDFLNSKYDIKEIDTAKLWANARIDNFYHKKGARKLVKKYGNMNKKTTQFEIYILNNKLLFNVVLKLLKKGII